MSNSPLAAAPRLAGLDLLKLALALLVVTIHANPFRGVSEELVWALGNGLARVAVPCFFVVAGYNFRPEVPGRSGRMALRYLWLHLLWLTIYTPYWWPSVAAGGVVQYLKWWVLGWWHLWFLTALAITVVLAQAVWRWRMGAILALALGLLLAGFALQTAVGWRLLSSDLWPIQVRNAFFVGLPMFLLGYLTRRAGLAGRVGFRTALWAAGLGLAAAVGESEVMRMISPSPYPLAPETLLSAALAGPALVLAAVQAPALPNWLARLPLGIWSAGVYFIHVGIVIVLSKAFDLPRVVVYLSAVTGALALTTVLIRLRLAKRLF